MNHKIIDGVDSDVLELLDIFGLDSLSDQLVNSFEAVILIIDFFLIYEVEADLVPYT